MNQTLQQGQKAGVVVAVLAAVATAVMVGVVWGRVSEIMDHQLLVDVPGPPHRAHFAAGTVGFYYEYEGPPPSMRYKVPTPELDCTVTVAATGVSIPLTRPGTVTTYQMGGTTGLLLLEGEIPVEADHTVGCKLNAPFDAPLVKLRVGPGIMGQLFGAMLPPLALYMAIVAALVAAALKWRRRNGG